MGVIERASHEIEIPTNAGQVIAGQEWKSASSTKNVLLLHGWQDNSNSFKKLANLLPADWHLVAIDFPGHGASSPRPDGVPYYVTDWVSHVRLVIQHLGWKKFTLIGHSMGAGVALMYAALFPESVEAVVSLDVVKQMSDVPGTTLKVMRNAVIALTEFDDPQKRPVEIYDSKQEALDAWYEKHKSNMTKAAAEIILERGLAPTEQGKFKVLRDPRLMLPPLFRIPLDQHRAVMQELKCDLLITKALSSPNWETPEVEKEFLDMYAKNSARFERVEVEGLHHVHVDTPERVAPQIVKFLQK